MYKRNFRAQYSDQSIEIIQRLVNVEYLRHFIFFLVCKYNSKREKKKEVMLTINPR